MRQPTIGEGGEVGVLGEDIFRSDVLLELHQKAVFAHVHVQRIESSIWFSWSADRLLSQGGDIPRSVKV